MPKQYLDDNGNPISSPAATAKVYLDDNGNPVQQSAPAPEHPWYEKAWDTIKGAATTEKIPWSPLYLGAEMGNRFGNKAQAIADEQIKQGNPIRAGIMASVADANKAVGGLLGGANSPVGMALSASPAGGPAMGRLAAGAGVFMGASQMGGRQEGETTPDALRRNLLGASAVVGAVPAAQELFGSKAFRNEPWMDKVKPGDVVVNSMEEARALSRKQAQEAAGVSAKVKPALSAPRSQLFREAAKEGVNLDLADATGNSVAHGVKVVTKRSLGGAGTFERNTNRNLSALDKWGNNLLNDIDQNGMNREQFGNFAKKKLFEDQQRLNDEAGRILNDLTERNGAYQPDATSIRSLAEKIISENREYYSKHPDLTPKKAWSIIENLSGKTKAVGKAASAVENVPRPEGFDTFHPDSATKAKAPKADTWADLHKLRSDLMNEYRSNPEIVGTPAEGWLKQMVEVIDNTMMSESSHLAPTDGAMFRKANELYSRMKSTYDNPQHPFYSAVRAIDGTQTGNTLAGLKPGFIRELRNVFGPDFGLYQRDFVSRLLDPRGQGFELHTLNSRLGRIPAEQLEAALERRQLNKLRIYSDVSRLVTQNINPSGTSDVIVRAGELTNAIHNPLLGAAEIGGTWGAAKAMTNPKLVNFFVKK